MNGTRLAWATLMSAVGIVPVASAAPPPAITSIALVEPTVDVSKPAASPTFKMTTTGDGNSIAFLYEGPSGEFIGQFFSVPHRFDRTILLRGYLPAPGAAGYETEFSPYTEPGTWTIATLQICDATFNCSYYDQAQLAAYSFKVVNPHRFDIQTPFPDAAVVLTPTVSVASGQPLRVKVHATDNESGVASVTVCSAAPMVAQQLCAVAPPPLHPIRNGDLIAELVLPAGTASGTYVVQNIYVRDVAGNGESFNNPGQIAAIFDGHANFIVSP